MHPGLTVIHGRFYQCQTVTYCSTGKAAEFKECCHKVETMILVNIRTSLKPLPGGQTDNHFKSHQAFPNSTSDIQDPLNSGMGLPRVI